MPEFTNNSEQLPAVPRISDPAARTAAVGCAPGVGAASVEQASQQSVGTDPAERDIPTLGWLVRVWLFCLILPMSGMLAVASFGK